MANPHTANPIKNDGIDPAAGIEFSKLDTHGLTAGQHGTAKLCYARILLAADDTTVTTVALADLKTHSVLKSSTHGVNLQTLYWAISITANTGTVTLTANGVEVTHWHDTGVKTTSYDCSGWGSGAFYTITLSGQNCTVAEYECYGAGT